jgi:PhoH-like ATPase
MPKSKVFVIDTNVILHDYECIYHFNDNDVILPITVLEELDRFKRGNDQINFQARQFVRVLDEIVGNELFNGGISLGCRQRQTDNRNRKTFFRKTEGIVS